MANIYRYAVLSAVAAISMYTSGCASTAPEVKAEAGSFLKDFFGLPNEEGRQREADNEERRNLERENLELRNQLLRQQQRR